MSLQAWDLACDSLCLPLLPHSQEAACPEAGEIRVPVPASLLFSCRVLGKLPNLPEPSKNMSENRN